MIKIFLNKLTSAHMLKYQQKLFAGVLILSLSICSWGQLRDPTRPPTGPIQSRRTTDGLHLSTIIVAKDRRLAIINNKLVRPGDMVDGVKVLHIYNTTVHVQRGDKVIVLPIAPTVKQESKKK
ncbi:MAG: hypothetical protein Tsb005_11070 [Gammaproteobacteria bacterium]